MAALAVVGNKLDPVLTGKAVAALFAHEEKKRGEKEGGGGKQALVGTYAQPLLAQVQLKAMIKQPKLRPVRVFIPHSFFSPEDEDHSVCLFCRTEDKKAIEEYLASHAVAGLDKVVSMTDVKKVYHTFKDKKKLLGEHTHFMCDTSVFTHVVNELGKTFSSRNNYPIPINYSAPKDIAVAVAKAAASSYMYLKGHTLTIRFGHTGMPAAQVTDNIMQVRRGRSVASAQTTHFLTPFRMLCAPRPATRHPRPGPAARRAPAGQRLEGRPQRTPQDGVIAGAAHIHQGDQRSDELRQGNSRGQ